MTNLFCHSGNLASLGNLSAWGWIGLILNLVFWVGLIVALILLVVWAIRRARAPAGRVDSATGQPTAGEQNTAREILQARYARGEITREQYALLKQDIG
jgi:putative membrane protein